MNDSMWSVVIGPFGDTWAVCWKGVLQGYVPRDIPKEDAVAYWQVNGKAEEDESVSEEQCNGLKASDLQVGGSHYKGMAIQPSVFIESNGLGWCAGNAIKYICRHTLKHGASDIDKAIHYLQLLKEWTYDGETEAKQTEI